MRDGGRPLFHSTRNGAIQPLSVDRIDEILKTAAARARRAGRARPCARTRRCHLIRRTRAAGPQYQLSCVAATAHHANCSARKHGLPASVALRVRWRLDMMRKADTRIWLVLRSFISDWRRDAEILIGRGLLKRVGSRKGRTLGSPGREES